MAHLKGQLTQYPQTETYMHLPMQIVGVFYFSCFEGKGKHIVPKWLFWIMQNKSVILTGTSFYQ